MNLDNRTRFPVIWFPGRMNYPGHTLTVVIKGTFRMIADGVSEPLAEGLPIEADLPFPGEEESSPYYDSDLAHFKPRADRLLVGRCYAPGGRPVKECGVTFQVGSWGRSLRVVGDRIWKRGLIRTGASDPQPFTEMDLRYERAYGGPRFAPNLVGRGYHRNKPQGDRELLLPNVEDPGHPIKSPSDPIAPAGFGPVSRTWAPRRNMIGSYGKPWFKARCPWFPEDLDWGVNNAAPPANQIEGYLQGDEPVVLENLRPDRPRFSTRLPSLRTRAFAERAGGSFDEIELRLDTLWVDAEELRLVLVWRGHCVVASEEFEDLDALHVVSEPMGASPRSRDQYRADLAGSMPVSAPRETAGPTPPDRARIEMGTDDPAADTVIGGAPVVGPGSSPPSDGPGPVDPGDPRHALLVQLEGLFAKLPPDEKLDEAATRDKNTFRQRIEDLRRILRGEVPGPAPTPAWTRERVLAAIEADEALSDADLSGLDLTGIDFRAGRLDGARLDRARLAGAILSRVDLSMSSLEGAEGEGVKLTGAKLPGCRMRMARLPGLEAEGADFGRADLAGSDLSGAQLGGARLVGARLQGSVLVGSRAAEANFSLADLSDVRAKGARWEQAVLEGATLTGAVLAEAFLSGATFDRARATRLDLTSSDLTEVSAVEADFSQAVLRSVKGDRSVWSKSRLDGAVLAESDFDDANFSRSSLRGADLTAASLRCAILRRTDLERAVVVRANLFEAMLPGARLIETDFRGSNLFAADLSDAELRSVQMDGANLGRTRFEELVR